MTTQSSASTASRTFVSPLIAARRCCSESAATCFSGAGSSACPPGAIVAANRVAVSSWCLIDLSCKSERRQEAGTESRAVWFSIPAFCAAESSVVARRATDELVHRLRGVEHLRRGLAATNRKRAIEQTDLHQHRRLVPVQVLVRQPVALKLRDDHERQFHALS